MGSSAARLPERCMKKCNVMVVEDNEADRFVISRKLSSVMPESRLIHSGSLGEAYAAYMKNEVDLVLLDLNLPDGYGPQTVTEVRRFNKSVPIIVVTGAETDNIVYESLRMGANNVVLKSQIEMPDFVNVLEQNIR